MNGLDEEAMAPQTFLYGCVLEAGKEVVFNPEDDDFEHQLDLRMVCVDASTKDELHMVEVEGQDTEGQQIKAALVSLKPSTLPSVCLGGFTITPPAIFRLKAGAGPIHLSGQHLIMMSADQSFDEEEDDDDEEEEEEDVRTSKKRPATSPALKSQKKMKMDEEDDDDDDEDMDDEDEDEESEDEESPVKAKQTPSKPKTPAQNGSSSKPGTPAKKQEKTPKGKGGKSPKAPQTPKALTPAEVKAKMLEGIKKGVALPKIQLKFENFVRNSFKVTDTKELSDLWKWRQAVADAK
ncbi:nucleophosmin 1a [Labrus mixtus]|uniref:nucleophosmin 1a n=1 Tax=Labrus mixtus TaxID=508554 RepID=UPI0029C0507E|nr:nucleophosmin 1a [Labrus mixtus]